MEVITIGESKLYLDLNPMEILIQHKITNAYIVHQPCFVMGKQLLEDMAKGHFKTVIIQGNPTDRIKQIKQSMRCIVAAGGIVVNNNNELLMIYRNDVWDLPKGKWDDGETISECALREVQEETGIVSVQLADFIDVTRHFYADPQGWVLKETYWYRMQAPNQLLVPQTEEGITEVCWVAPNKLAKRLLNTYYSINYILEKSGYV